MSPAQIVGIVIVVIAAILLIISFAAEGIMKSAIEKVGTSTMKVDVKLRKVTFSPFSGNFGMNDLIISNPEGFDEPTFMELSEFDIKTQMGSLMSDTVQVNSIKMDNVQLTLEQKGLKSNLNEIISSLPSKKEPVEEKPSEKPGKKLQIDELEMSNIKVRFKPPVANAITFSIPTIKMTDLGKEDGIDSVELTTKLLTAITKGIAEHGAGQLPTELVTSLTGTLKDKGIKALSTGIVTGKEALEKGTGVGKGVGEKVMEGGKSITEGAGKAIEGLLGGSKEE